MYYYLKLNYDHRSAWRDDNDDVATSRGFGRGGDTMSCSGHISETATI